MEKLEGTKGVVRCRKSKERQCNGKKKNDKMIDLQNSQQNSRLQQEHDRRGKLMCS